MAAAAILDLQRMLFWAPSSPCMANVKLQTKFGVNNQEVADIHMFVYLQDGCRPPSWICYSPIFGPPAETP